MIVQGDCIEVMRDLPEASVTAIVTDPPYGLEFMGKEWDRLGAPKGFRRKENEADVGRDNVFGRTSRTSPEYAAGAQMQEWHRLWAVEALRVLRPGGHALIFGGTRTYHRLACAVEDAGFEVRDCLMWLYGQGFPKSLDVSKAIDKAGGGAGMPENDRIAFAKDLRAARESKGLSRDDLAAWFPQYSEVTRNWERLDAGFRVPREIDYNILVERLGVAESWRLCVRAEDKRRLVSDSGTDRRGDGTVIGLGHPGREWEATTEAARLWSGYGTALKPAWEPILLARKPLIGTVEKSCREHGTGALNIDGCRIGPGHANGRGRDGEASAERRYTENGGTTIAAKPGPRGGDPAGRWPANLILDEEAGALLDEQAPDKGQAAPLATRHSDKPGRSCYGAFQGSVAADFEPHDAPGGASRFFYCAKASKRDRGEGNGHPTVKPVELMRWLVRLVKGPGDNLVLDPFAGSGTTGVACALEGVPFVLIEREAQYVEIINRRLADVSL
jgi:DNA modification methylase